jgi:hypothetical protein
MVLIAAVASAAACDRGDARPQGGSEPAPSAAAAPPSTAPGRAGLRAETWSEGGLELKARYVRYKSLDEATAAQPAGSIDAMVVDFPATGLDIVLIEVMVVSPAPGGPTQFTTTFSSNAAEVARKTWGAASGNPTGPFRALVSVPQGVTEARTRGPGG